MGVVPDASINLPVYYSPSRTSMWVLLKMALSSSAKNAMIVCTSQDAYFQTMFHRSSSNCKKNDIQLFSPRIYTRIFLLSSKGFVDLSFKHRRGRWH